MRHALGVALLALAAAAAPAGATVINFAPASPLAAIEGESLLVDVVVSELGDEIVSAYDMDILFDSAVLQAIGVSFTANLGGEADSLQESILSVGAIALAEVSFLSDDDLDALQGTQVTLATLEFSALSTASTDVSFGFGAGKDVKGRDAMVIISDGPSGPGGPGVPPVDVTEPAPASLLAAFALIAGAFRAKRGYKGIV